MTKIDLNIRLTGGDILRDDRMEHSDISIAGQSFSDNASGTEVSLDGYYVLPGIIDLHGDAFERHLAPRPSAPFDPIIGLRSCERELLANGVTTAYLAQSWSWEGGFRSPDYSEGVIKSVAAFKPQMTADMRVQIRFEYFLTSDGHRLLTAAETGGVDYIVFNNHLDQGLEMVETRPQALANWAAQNKRTMEEHLQLMRDAKATEPQVPAFIHDLGKSFAQRGISSGSHDDDTPEIRHMFNGAGARICEFATNAETAAAAHDLGSPVLMGAPNVVRGGSQSGNIAAIELVRKDLCDVLVSDYYAPALATAAWTMIDNGDLDLVNAWKMISTNAADAMRWTDLGRIKDAQRADCVFINKETRQIEGSIAQGKVGFVTGEIANRFLGAHAHAHVVAA